MIEILLISHSSKGAGAEIVFLNTVNVLIESNKYSISVMLPESEGYLFEQLKNKKINLIISKNYPFQNSILRMIFRIPFNAITIFKLLKFIKLNNIEYIYSNTIVNYIGIIVALISKKKHVWHIHEMPNEHCIYFNKKIDFLVAKLFKNSKQVIFVSNNCKKEWFFRLKLQDKNIKNEIIYNPIKKLDYINSIENTNKLVIGFSGTYCLRKNIELLINTYIILKQKYPKLELKLCGYGLEENLLKKYGVETLKKYEIEVLSYMKIEEFFSKINIFVLPSLTESWGLVILEAIYSKIITVTTNQSALTEVLKDRENTFFINPYSKVNLYFTLNEIILNYEKIKKEMLSNNSQLIKANKFNSEYIEKIVKTFT